MHHGVGAGAGAGVGGLGGWLVVIIINQAVWVAGWLWSSSTRRSGWLVGCDHHQPGELGGWLVVIVITHRDPRRSNMIIHLRSTSGEGKRGKTCAVKVLYKGSARQEFRVFFCMTSGGLPESRSAEKLRQNPNLCVEAARDRRFALAAEHNNYHSQAARAAGWLVGCDHHQPVGLDG